MSLLWRCLYWIRKLFSLEHLLSPQSIIFLIALSCIVVRVTTLNFPFIFSLNFPVWTIWFKWVRFCQKSQGWGQWEIRTRCILLYGHGSRRIGFGRRHGVSMILQHKHQLPHISQAIGLCGVLPHSHHAPLLWWSNPIRCRRTTHVSNSLL